MNSSVRSGIHEPHLPIPAGGKPVPTWPTPLRRLRETTLKSIPADLFAGAVSAAFLIPATLAYTALAGLPPQSGFAAVIAGGIAFALFRDSRTTLIGTTSSLSLLLGSALGDLALAGTPAAVPQAALLTLMVGAGLLAVRLFRAEQIMYFVSDSVLVGFKAGLAVTVMSGQLPVLLGIHSPATHPLSDLAQVVSSIPWAHGPTAAVGLTCTALLIWAGRRFPGRPVALAVLALAVLAGWSLDLPSQGVPCLGIVQAGVPSLHLPDLRFAELDRLVPIALACVVLSALETISSGRVFAGPPERRLDLPPEFLALGCANLAAGLVQGCPVAAGMSQSAVNARAGAVTPLSSLTAVVLIAVLLGPLGPWAAFLPNSALAAVVFSAVIDLVDPAAFRRLFRSGRTETAVALATFVGTILFGSLRGVIGGALLSLLLLIRRSSVPTMAILGRVPGSDIFGDLNRHPSNERIPGVLLFRLDSILTYFNCDYVRDTLLALVEDHRADLRLVIFYLGSVPLVDLAGAEMLGEVHARLKEEGIELRLAGAHGPVRDRLRSAGLEATFGRLRPHQPIDLVLDAWHADHTLPPPAAADSA